MPIDFFGRSPRPNTLPSEMQIVIDKLRILANPQACLEKTYTICTAKYRGYRFQTYTRIGAVFTHSIDKLCHTTGFINYVLRTLLIKSRYFTEQDIKLKWTLIRYFSPHQYLQVKIDNTWIDIDIWEHNFSIPYGDHAHGFH